MERGRTRSADGLLCQPNACSCLLASSSGLETDGRYVNLWQIACVTAGGLR
jgi:hypothetical protein